MLLNHELHKELLKIFTKLEMADRIYYVGGMVRDFMLNRKSVDIDIVLEKANPDDIFTLNENFGEWKGKDFPVYKFRIEADGKLFDIDLAVARRERSTGDGYRDFEVEFGEEIDIHADLSRRDITMNAMAFPMTNLLELIDDFNGEEHLKNGLILHTSDAFAEDPLRVFRVARFASRYGFTVHKDTIALMKVLRPSTKTLFKERVYDEMAKMFSSSKRPSTFFKVLKASNNLEEWFPVIHKMIGLPHLHQHDVFDHTMEVIDNVMSAGGNVNTLVGALYHDAGKILTENSLLPKHYGHDKAGLELVDEIVTRLRIPNKPAKCIRDSIAFHLKITRVPEMRISNVLRMVETLDKNGTLDNIIALSIADRKSKDLGAIDSVGFEKIRIAQYVNDINVPNDLQDKFKVKDQKRINPERITNLILEWRVCKFKSLFNF